MPDAGTLITAASGLIIGIITAGRAILADRNSNANALLDRYEKRLDDQDKKITDMQQFHRDEINALRQEQQSERTQWADERKQWESKIDTLNRLNGEKDLKIMELSIEVKSLTARRNRKDG